MLLYLYCFEKTSSESAVCAAYDTLYRSLRPGGDVSRPAASPVASTGR